jgi:cysteine synthase B
MIPACAEKSRGLVLFHAHAQARGEGVVLDQFGNADNPLGHFSATGPEVWEQTRGRITHFISSMGTTGVPSS